MAGRPQEGPKGSEVSIEEWLKQIGATEIRYVGDEDGGGPPDFLMKYADEKIAVEVTLLHDSEGWRRDKERAFERELGHLIEEVSMEEGNAPRWHSRCEYDPREPRPPRSDCKGWKGKVRQALRTPGMGGNFQLLSPERMRGRGVYLNLVPASNEGSFAGVSVDRGYLVGPILAERVVACVKEKTNKIRQGKRSKKYGRWWLVFDDEMLRAPVGVLGADERKTIKKRVQKTDGREQWSKIVMVSRFQPTPPPSKPPKWFYALWEDPRHPALPESPSVLSRKYMSKVVRP